MTRTGKGRKRTYTGKEGKRERVAGRRWIGGRRRQRVKERSKWGRRKEDAEG